MPLGDEQYEAYKLARTTKPPNILYKYTTVSTARIIFSSRKLRFHSPLKYNDPFDSQWDPIWTLKTREAMSYERSLIERALRDPTSWPANAHPTHRQAMDLERKRIESLPEQERDQSIASFVQDAVSKPDDYKAFDQWRHGYQSRLRVLCLSEDPCSDLMWAHYADEHRGVVFGFSTASIEERLKCPVERVVYQDGPPAVIDHKEWFRSHLFGNSWQPDGDDLRRKLALTKYSSWQHEREWRFALTARQRAPVDFIDIAFPDASLVELTTGLRMDDTTAIEMESSANALHANVRHFRISKDQSQIALVRTEYRGRKS